MSKRIICLLLATVFVVSTTGCATSQNPYFWQNLSQSLNEINEQNQRQYQQQFDNRMRAYEVLGNINNRGGQRYRITDKYGFLKGYAEPE